MSGFGGADGAQLTFGSAAAAKEGDGALNFSSAFGSVAAAAGDAFAPAGQFGAGVAARRRVRQDQAEGEGEGEGDDKVAEVESTAEFVPVVQLEEIETKTHEEEEEVIFKMRSKLFRFTETLLNKGSGKKEWIERGVGDMKLLKHRESSKIRVLMRQEKTMKVIANHIVDPRIELAPNAGSDRSWVWSVFDFSEGDLVEEVFALRFGTAENSNKFKDAFLEAQAEMTKLCAGEDAAPDAAADDAAAALEGLKATDEAPAEEAPAAE